MFENLTNLSMYIKNEFIKKYFYESCIEINTIEEAEDIAYKISNGEIYNIHFLSSYIKNIFFDKITTNRPDINIINCNSSVGKFKKDIWESNGLIIYNNVNKCNDMDIINTIINNKGIIIC